MIPVHHLLDEFVVVAPDQRATVEPRDPTLYPRLDKNYNDFKGHQLVSCHEFDSDWGVWEIHPNGDELVLLMSGCVTLVLDRPDGQVSVTLEKPGSYVIVPRDTWHTAKTSQSTRLLFMTPGEGTRNESR